MPEPITPEQRLAEIRDRDERALSRAEDPVCALSQAEYDRTLVLDEVDRLNAELERRIDADAEALADKTLMKGLTVEDGAVNLDLIPPREIAAIWVHCAVGMLGDAPNYTETEVKMPSVSMEISPAGSYDRYALIVQRVGKLTPHEARQQAEARAEAAERAARDLARVIDVVALEVRRAVRLANAGDPAAAMKVITEWASEADWLDNLDAGGDA